MEQADTETLDMSEASTHLTLAVYVQFWQTVEAALHVLLMRMWLAELAPESVPQSVFDAMDEIIDVARNPDTGGTFSLPASLLLHAAIRNAGNGRSGVLRRAALVSGKGNLTATAAVLTTLCESPPTLSEIMEEMMMWDSAPDSTITGGDHPCIRPFSLPFHGGFLACATNCAQAKVWLRAFQGSDQSTASKGTWWT